MMVSSPSSLELTINEGWELATNHLAIIIQKTSDLTTSSYRKWCQTKMVILNLGSSVEQAADVLIKPLDPMKIPCLYHNKGRYTDPFR